MMTTSEKTAAWRQLFSSLHIDVESSSPPMSRAKGADDSRDERSWFQTLTRFTKRGFLRVLVTPGDEHIGIHTQYAVPGADADYALTLKEHLNDLSGMDWSADTTESPWTLYAAGIPVPKAKAIIEVFLRLADHITAAEDGARAGVLAEEFGARTTNFADKAIQPDAKTKERTSGSPFESIGDPTSPAESGPADAGHGNPGLKSFRVAVREGVIHANIDLQAQPTKRDQSALLDAFSRALPVRFDIVLLSADFVAAKSPKSSAAASIELMMRANFEADTGAIAGDLGRYFERVKKFNDLGLSLLEVLGGESARAAKTTPRATSKPKKSSPPQRRSANLASRQPATSRTQASATRESSEDVVLSFGGGALDVADITTDALRPGDYTDPRIRREDATTPLVDVVLRHPGFSDKSMRQVLSILLDVTYYDATKLTESAPCLIAWGISQERAGEFKSVIENAGGRVTLVEPDSLS